MKTKQKKHIIQTVRCPEAEIMINDPTLFCCEALEKICEHLLLNIQYVLLSFLCFVILALTV